MQHHMIDADGRTNRRVEVAASRAPGRDADARGPGRPDPQAVIARVAAMVEEAAAQERGWQEKAGRVVEDADATSDTGDRAFGGAPGSGDRAAELARRARPGRDAGGRRRQRMAAAVAEAMQTGAESLDVPPLAVATGWADVDHALAGRAAGVGLGSGHAPVAGLLRGQLHEWFAVPPGGEPGPKAAGRPRWRPPMTVLAHLADQAASTAVAAGTGGVIAWVGNRVWPAPGFAAARDRLEQSIYLDPPDEASRLWTLELLLRSSAVTAVVADGSGLSMAATRRLQLAARAGRALVLLARPAHELLSLSAASTRWTVEPVPTTRDQPEWRLSLRRCKASAESRSVGLTVGLDSGEADGRRANEQAADGPWRIHWSGSAVEMSTQEASRTITHDRMRMHGRREHGDESRGGIDSGQRREHGRTGRDGQRSAEREAFLHPVLTRFAGGGDGGGRGRHDVARQVGPAA
jgi:hypothetical protein